MRYAIAFLLLGLGWLALAARLGGPGWLFISPAASFLIVGIGYTGAGPQVFGKRADGRLAPWAIVLLFPYVGIAWLSWRLLAINPRGVTCHEILPGIWIGRRVGAARLPAGTQLVVDLTCELWEPSAVRHGRNYLCLPTLDATAPSEKEFLDLLPRIIARDGVVYIHCAKGHGRSACVAAALMVRTGAAGDVREAEMLLKALRPGVGLNRAQRAFVHRIAALP